MRYGENLSPNSFFCVLGIKKQDAMLLRQIQQRFYLFAAFLGFCRFYCHMILRKNYLNDENRLTFASSTTKTALLSERRQHK